MITNHQMKELHEKNEHRLLGIADISADIQGSIEFLMKTTSIDHPLFIYDPRTHDIYDEYVLFSFFLVFVELANYLFLRSNDRMYMYRDGILFLAVDNLPTEFPREATIWFGDHLVPYLDNIVKADPTNEYLFTF